MSTTIGGMVIAMASDEDIAVSRPCDQISTSTRAVRAVGGIREVVAVIVAADSPFGRAMRAIDDLAGHLPPAQKPQTCPLCVNRPRPCARFDEAAHHVHSAVLHLGELVRWTCTPPVAAASRLRDATTTPTARLGTAPGPLVRRGAR